MKTEQLSVTDRVRAVRYFGAEAEANGSPIDEYLQDIALRYGKKCFRDLTKAEQREAREAFRLGRQDEKKAVGGHRA